jgi:hypothetical protein
MAAGWIRHRKVVDLAGSHAPARWQIEGDDADLTGLELDLQTIPVRSVQSGQPIDLLDQQHVAGMRVCQEPEKLWSSQLGAALGFNVPGRDLHAAVCGECLDLAAGAGCILFVGRTGCLVRIGC